MAAIEPRSPLAIAPGDLDPPAAVDADVVHRSGTETINGAKTFGTPPAMPVGNLLTHPVRRDDARLTDQRAPLAELANVAGGWLQLDGGVKVPQNLLPAVALVEYLGQVGSQTAMLALTGQRGDWCTRTDQNVDWQLIAEPSTSLASWRAMTYPASPVTSVNGRAGGVTGLAEQSAVDAALTGKADTVHGHAGSDLTSTVPTNRLPGASPTAYGIVRLTGDLGGTSAEPTVPALATRPRGLIADGVRTSSASTATATERPVLEVSAAVVAGRVYRISAPSLGIFASAAGGYAVAMLKHTVNGAQPGTTSPQLTQAVVDLRVAGVGYSVGVFGLFFATATGTLRVLLSYLTSGVTATMQGGATFPITLLVEDLGSDPGNTAILRS